MSKRSPETIVNQRETPVMGLDVDIGDHYVVVVPNRKMFSPPFFVGIDQHSGGYPYFTTSVSQAHWHNSFYDALLELDSVPSMRGYADSDKVDFNRIGVAKIRASMMVPLPGQAERDRLKAEKIFQKLAPDEREFLERFTASGVRETGGY